MKTKVGGCSEYGYLTYHSGSDFVSWRKQGKATVQAGETKKYKDVDMSHLGVFDNTACVSGPGLLRRDLADRNSGCYPSRFDWPLNLCLKPAGTPLLPFLPPIRHSYRRGHLFCKNTVDCCSICDTILWKGFAFIMSPRFLVFVLIYTLIVLTNVFAARPSCTLFYLK